MRRRSRGLHPDLGDEAPASIRSATLPAPAGRRSRRPPRPGHRGAGHGPDRRAGRSAPAPVAGRPRRAGRGHRGWPGRGGHERGQRRRASTARRRRRAAAGDEAQRVGVGRRHVGTAAPRPVGTADERARSRARLGGTRPSGAAVTAPPAADPRAAPPGARPTRRRGTRPGRSARAARRVAPAGRGDHDAVVRTRSVEHGQGEPGVGRRGQFDLVGQTSACSTPRSRAEGSGQLGGDHPVRPGEPGGDELLAEPGDAALEVRGRARPLVGHGGGQHDVGVGVERRERWPVTATTIGRPPRARSARSRSGKS